MVDTDGLRNSLRNALSEYHRAVAEEKTSERMVNSLIGNLEKLAPHAAVADLMFHGEKERTDEEIVEEAVNREAIFRNQGETALLVHIETQLRMASESDTLSPPHRNYIQYELPRIQVRIREIADQRRLS